MDKPRFSLTGAILPATIVPLSSAVLTSDLATFAGAMGRTPWAGHIRLTPAPQYPNLNGANLQGPVSGVVPRDGKVVFCIRVEDIRWIKPTLDDPGTEILYKEPIFIHPPEARRNYIGPMLNDDRISFNGSHTLQGGGIGWLNSC